MAKKVSAATSGKLKAELPGARRRNKAARPAQPPSPASKSGPREYETPDEPAPARGGDATVLDRLAATVLARRTADPAISHSARLMSRGTAKVAQKFGEEAVECLIEAVEGNREALIAESADVLYHLVVLWVHAGVAPAEVWDELRRREGISGVAEKARRKTEFATTKIP